MFVVQLEIEDATRKLRTGDFGVHADPAQRYNLDDRYHYSKTNAGFNMFQIPDQMPL